MVTLDETKTEIKAAKKNRKVLAQRLLKLTSKKEAMDKEIKDLEEDYKDTQVFIDWLSTRLKNQVLLRDAVYEHVNYYWPHEINNNKKGGMI